MVTFERLNGGDLFILQSDISKPASARVALLLPNASSQIKTFTVGASTWLEAQYVFFAPSAKRDWARFASLVGSLFAQSSGLQFVYVTEDANGVTATTSLVVNVADGCATLAAPAQFNARNVTVNLQAPPMNPPTIDWDDINNQFMFSNANDGDPNVSLTIVNAISGSYDQASVSQSLTLSLAGEQAGCIYSDYLFASSDLDVTEAGLLYFAPPSQAGYPLTTLRYPLVQLGVAAPSQTFAAEVDQLRLCFCFDELDPLNVLRTYFQITDRAFASYFAAANGTAFSLATTSSCATESISRFVLANRPVRNVTDQQSFYLSPAGCFAIIPATRAKSSRKLRAARNTDRLLCGICGTEYFEVSSASATADTLTFVPNCPAYAPYSTDAPTQLEGSSNCTVTSWVKFSSTGSAYVSQPQEAPLFEQRASSRVRLTANDASVAHLLEFLPLPTWSPDGTDRAQTPALPMVPYAGIPCTVDLAPFRQMETLALNPTRRNNIMAAPHNATRQLSPQALNAEPTQFAMTPQGMLAGLSNGVPAAWTSLQMALSASGIVQLTEMGADIQNVLKQNRIFFVGNTLTGPDQQQLFQFAGKDQQANIADWIFNLSPSDSAAEPDSPPLLLFKFWNGQTISELVDDASLWSSSEIFITAKPSIDEVQAYLQGVITDAKAAVDADANCIYANFYSVVTDPSFAGILAINGSLQLNNLPTAIQAVMGGMTRVTDKGERVSNLDKFRTHHIGLQINDTDPKATTPTISQSSFFALVDYKKPEDSTDSRQVDKISFTPLGFEVEYLHALFTNSELRDFDCQLNLTINELFDVNVTLDTDSRANVGDGDEDNVVKIRGSYQSHSSGDDSDGAGVYSFIAEKNFNFTFTENAYLKSIELTKLQFSFEQSDAKASMPQLADGGTTHIDAHFSIWGSLEFNELKMLDLFSFESLSFADLGIGVSFDITLQPPSTTAPTLTFDPGDLRLDLAETTPREGSTSLLSLLPFRLKSFLYSQHADETLESLDYFALGSVPGLSSVASTFNYALAFDLDLGAAGSLVGSLAAFKFNFLIGWLNDGGVAFGVQMPEADGKLEIKIEGVFDLLIEDFVLRYEGSSETPMLVIGMLNTTVEILGTRLPPSGKMDFVLFKPTNSGNPIGWMLAYDNTEEKEGRRINGFGHERHTENVLTGEAINNDAALKRTATDEDEKVFELKYMGLGQHVGPSPEDSPQTFKEFLSFMTEDFIEAFKNREYDKLYHPDAKWLIVADAKLLKILELGFVFYDVTPFYSLMLNVEDLFEFEITYTKVTDTIGLYYASLALPDALRTFQAGAASITLPSLEVSVYTNGNWKTALGFPKGDDWSACFRIEFMAGPVPLTGSGGFYLASLCSAVSPVFHGDYPCLLAFGLAARIGVGKDFTAGPLSAGVSITFFGIIEGAAGYLTTGSDAIFHEPNALMLSGQFGLIGEIYGAIDFVIIKASVNVTLSASVGVVMCLETHYGDGSLLLYVMASVSLSVSVSISLVFFSITISFSYNATFRFEWQLIGSSQQQLRLRTAPTSRLLASTQPVVLPLIADFTTAMPLWFLPELTVKFADMTTPGAPQLAFGLALEFDPDPSAKSYADFKPFEVLTTQLTTWALMHALALPSYDAAIAHDRLRDVNSDPLALTGFITYDLLLQQLAVFSNTTITVPAATKDDPKSVSAAVFPMPPFVALTTTGRLNGNAKDDFSYSFGSCNLVSEQYLAMVDAYLEQMFVNAGSANKSTALHASDAVNIPLSQQVFVEYFKGLIRGAVNQLLQTMENNDKSSEALTQLFCDAVAAGGFAGLGGQMSSMFRSGARLPYVDGLSIPGASIAMDTNPLQSLLWQQFPVGGLSKLSHATDSVTSQYTVQLQQGSVPQSWITVNVNYALTNLVVDPYTGLTAAQVVMPQAPTLIPFTNSGPQSFSFGNRTQWTQAAATVTLGAFPPSLLTLSAQQAEPLSMLVQSRKAGKAYAPDGEPLPSSEFSFATTVQLIACRVPGKDSGSFIANIYAISGYSQADQNLLALLLKTTDSVASIEILYQTAAGAAGLNSSAVNKTDVFVLRTNTTTVSAPPAQMLADLAAIPAPTVSVGANLGDVKGFLQILEESAITNATGYYLRYKTQAGGDLPTELFNAGPAPITILIRYKASVAANSSASPAQLLPYHNTLLLNSYDSSLVYYATTVDPQFNLQYTSIASGSVGVSLVRPQSASLMQSADGAQHTAKAFIERTHQSANSAADVHRALAAAGAAPAQLNSLYNLLTYQVMATDGFVQSNLSAPVQPQAETDAIAAAPRTFRAFIPLYAVAKENRGTSAQQSPNRYASIGDGYAVQFALMDAFGNQLPRTLQLQRKNLYFDSIVALDAWQGVIPTFDFQNAANNTVHINLTPSESAFAGLDVDADRASAALSLYRNISTQLHAPGVTLSVSSSLSLTVSNGYQNVPLSNAQSASVKQLVDSILQYLEKLATGQSVVWDVKPVTIAITLPKTAAALPSAFGLVVQVNIERDIALIDPSLITKDGVLTLPSAQHVASSLSPSAAAQSAVGEFADQFSNAFPALLLAIGMGGAQNMPNTKSAQRRALLRKSLLAADPGSSTGESATRALWAIARSLVEITIDNPTTHQPFYSSPQPLLNALESGVVPMPTMPDGLAQLGATQSFTDVDLDVLNNSFFSAVDTILQPASAAALFSASQDAYTAVAYGRERLATGYSQHEVDWMFSDEAPFTGSADGLDESRSFIEQQCRSALLSAYSIDTILQFPVAWAQALPADAFGNISLFGSVQPVTAVASAQKTVYPCAQIEVPAAGGDALFTFAYSSPDAVSVPGAPVALQFSLSHLQVFTSPDPGNDQARPSLWLQLISPTAGAQKLPSLTLPLGGDSQPITIPVVLREYPAPPTLLLQSGFAAAQDGNVEESMQKAAGWTYAFQYQAQLTEHDRLHATVTWNTMTVDKSLRADALGDTRFTLFEALCRFSAAFPILKPVLMDFANVHYVAAAMAFASLVNDVASNKDWNPADFALQKLSRAQQAQDGYVVQDIGQLDGSRLITLSWGKVESSMPGGVLTIQAIQPTGASYKSQTLSRLPDGLQDVYTPIPTIIDNRVAHQVSISGIDVLSAENAMSAVQIERNRIVLNYGSTAWSTKDEFVYMTPLVQPAQPVTPLLNNAAPVNIALLEQLEPSSACPSPAPTTLCQRIYNMLLNLLTVSAQSESGDSSDSAHRLKIGCSFSYPLSSAAGLSPANDPLMPLVPAVFARSFDVPNNDMQAQLGSFSCAFAAAILAWMSDNDIACGPSANPVGAQLVFDVTLYAQLSGNNRPLLRLGNLQLALVDVTASNA